MPQQFKKDEEHRPIKRAGVIRPKEMVTVYATELLGKSASEYATGDAMEVHKVLADKMVASGKATLEAPKKAEAKK